MSSDDKFLAIRKGLLEFLLLKIISADKVYVADILGRLAAPSSRRRKAPSTRCSARCGAKAWSITNGRNPRRVRRASTTASPARAVSQLTELNDYWREHQPHRPATGTVRPMNKVTTVNLNGRAFQVEEQAYERCALTSTRPRPPLVRRPGLQGDHGRSRAGDRRQGLALPSSQAGTCWARRR